MRKSKSIFIKNIECQVCHKIGSLQILGNYYRIRHYEKLVNGKPIFTYHKNDKEYIERILSNLRLNPDQTDHNSHDQNVKESNSLNENSWGWSSSLVRTLALRAKGRRFKSGPAHQLEFLPVEFKLFRV
jgi:hypothetical protein